MVENESSLVLSLIEEQIKTFDGYRDILSKITDDRLKFYVTQLKGALDADDWSSYELWVSNISNALDKTVTDDNVNKQSFGR